MGTDTLAAVDGWSFTLRWDEAEYYGSDSIYLQDVAKYNHQVEISLKHSKFDPTLATWWIYDVLLGGNGGKDNKGATVARGKMADTSYVHKVGIAGWVSPSDEDGTPLVASFNKCYFEDIPFGATEFNWVGLDLKAIGDFTTFSNTVPA